MAVTVTLLIAWRGEDEYSLCTRSFDALPTAGDQIQITQGVNGEDATHAVAYVVVYAVMHDLRLTHTTPAHAFVYVEPAEPADVTLRQLALLFPEGEHSAD